MAAVIAVASATPGFFESRLHQHQVQPEIEHQHHQRDAYRRSAILRRMECAHQHLLHRVRPDAIAIKTERDDHPPRVGRG
jgi:hypothetical protein